MFITDLIKYIFVAPLHCVNRYYPDACNAKIYYECWNGVATKFVCPEMHVWDDKLQYCNWDFSLFTTIQRTSFVPTQSPSSAQPTQPSSSPQSTQFISSVQPTQTKPTQNPSRCGGL